MTERPEDFLFPVTAAMGDEPLKQANPGLTKVFVILLSIVLHHCNNFLLYVIHDFSGVTQTKKAVLSYLSLSLKAALNLLCAKLTLI